LRIYEKQTPARIARIQNQNQDKGVSWRKKDKKYRAQIGF